VATRLEPFGLEQFDPELTAEGLMAERFVGKSCGGKAALNKND